MPERYVFLPGMMLKAAVTPSPVSALLSQDGDGLSQGERRLTLPPLPLGEGWGEGEAFCLRHQPVGTTKLAFRAHEGRTVLAESYVELPLQIQRPRLTPAGDAVLTLLTPAGGLFDGDSVNLTVEVYPGASVVLRQASATQLHRSEDRGIKLSVDLHVAAGARLSYEPYELIPHEASDYQQILRLYLDHGADARLTEVVSPGRLWEHFGYRRLELRTEVFLDRDRILLDIQRITPGETDHRLLLGEYSHFGSHFHFGSHVDASDADRLDARFAELGVFGSASLLPSYGVGSRMLGNSAESLFQAMSPRPK